MAGFPGASYDAWKTTEPAADCPNCGEGHTLDVCTWVPTCRDCDADAAEVEPGVRGRYCEECAEIYARIAERERRERDYEAACEAKGDAMREGGW